MVSACFVPQLRQRGFSVVEMVIILVIIAILFMMVTPLLVSSISEHRALNMLSALKADLEWARNYALSTNQRIKISVPSETVCGWSTKLDDPVTALEVSTPQLHEMTATQLSDFKGVTCAFSSSVVPFNGPVFNGLGLNSNGTFIATITATGTVRRWVLTVDLAGDAKVVTQ